MYKYIGIEELKDINNRDILEKYNDVFSQELIMRSVKTRCDYEYYERFAYDYIDTKSERCDISIHHDVPLDVRYKSNSSGERVFLEIDLNYLNFDKKVIFNVNGRKNIEIVESDNPQSMFEKFEITKEQLYELCNASSLRIQIRDYEGVKWEGGANGFITILQVLYNEAFDNSLFTEAHNTALSYTMTEVKKIEEKIKTGEALVQQNEQQKKQRRKNDIILAIIMPLILVICALFLIFGENKMAAAIASGIAACINGIYFVVRYAS